MMSIEQLQARAHALFFRPDIPESTCRHNAEAWVKSIQYLGDKWLLAKPINAPVVQ